MPGGLRQEQEVVIDENSQTDAIIKNNIKDKPIEFYKYAIEKIAELKFIFGETLEKNKIFNKSPYLTYLYAFLILFALTIGTYPCPPKKQ